MQADDWWILHHGKTSAQIIYNEEESSGSGSRGLYRHGRWRPTISDDLDDNYYYYYDDYDYGASGSGSDLGSSSIHYWRVARNYGVIGAFLVKVRNPHLNIRVC